MQLDVHYPDPADAPVISALYARTWRATYPNEEHGISIADIEVHTEQMESPERVERFRQNLQNFTDDPLRFFRVAKFDGEVVGVCGGVEEAEFVHMASLYVSPEHQGKGIGGALMQEFLRWSNPEKPARIHVVTYNVTAIRFYERWGFVDTGERFTEERFKMKSGNALPEMVMLRPSPARNLA